MNLDPNSPAAGLSGFRDRAYSFAKDWTERVLWTAVEAGAAAGVVYLADAPAWIAVPVATGLAAVKGYAAKHVGSKGTASTAPGL